MIRKVLLVASIAGAVALGACNMVRGAGTDLQSAANCTENMMKAGQC